MILHVPKVVQKYMVKFVVDLTAQTLIARFSLTLESQKVIDLWNKTMTEIINKRLGPVLTAGLNAGKANVSLCAKFDAEELSPDVQYEIIAVWGSLEKQKDEAIQATAVPDLVAGAWCAVIGLSRRALSAASASNPRQIGGPATCAP